MPLLNSVVLYFCRTWYDAKGDCSSKGGVLFYIQNQDQQNFILKMVLNVHEYYPVWLGLIDQAQEETWKWVSGLFVC